MSVQKVIFCENPQIRPWNWNIGSCIDLYINLNFFYKDPKQWRNPSS